MGIVKVVVKCLMEKGASWANKPVCGKNTLELLSHCNQYTSYRKYQHNSIKQSALFLILPHGSRIKRL